MKRITKIFAILLASGISGFQLFAGEITTDLSKLPAPASEFAAKMFPKAKIVGIEIDTSLTKPVEYEATLSDGSKIEFDSKGAWTEVESKFAGVPASILPEAVAQYLDANYKGQKIKSASKGRYGFEVDLINGLELKFDVSGKFLGIDD